MKAEGTWEEVMKLAEEVAAKWFVGSEYKCDAESVKNAVIEVFKSRGFLIKPEWEQAYDDTIKLANSIGCGISEKFTCAMSAVRLMHDRIVELEKKLDVK